MSQTPASPCIPPDLRSLGSPELSAGRLTPHPLPITPHSFKAAPPWAQPSGLPAGGSSRRRSSGCSLWPAAGSEIKGWAAGAGRSRGPQRPHQRRCIHVGTLLGEVEQDLVWRQLGQLPWDSVPPCTAVSRPPTSFAPGRSATSPPLPSAPAPTRPCDREAVQIGQGRQGHGNGPRDDSS